MIGKDLEWAIRTILFEPLVPEGRRTFHSVGSYHKIDIGETAITFINNTAYPCLTGEGWTLLLKLDTCFVTSVHGDIDACKRDLTVLRLISPDAASPAFCAVGA